MKTNVAQMPVSPADELGKIRAQIADLKAREKAVVNQILSLDAQYVQGALFGATVVEQFRDTTAWKKIAEKLNASRQMITAYTTQSRVVSVKTTGLRA